MIKKPTDIKAIFSEALEKHTPLERSTYLCEVCGNDTDLREKIENLLKAHSEAGNFLDAPILEEQVNLDIPLTEMPGTIIGRYKLLEKIGEGGMAVVYMAQQEKPIRRQVALKIIKLGMDTKSVIARFEAERQALALMDHPHIAKVLDAGATSTGRPYFVMELVRGLSITEYCDQNNLNMEKRQSLFIQVCSAVQHAHQKGIIHRDIKPSNVMVTLHDSQSVPKVIDFGIAKAINQKLTEKTLFTRYAQMIGTPAYMSPEQAEMSDLDIDTRTDIYSLGILLYELLTGTPPFSEEELHRAGYLEIQRIIREQEPTKPSTKLSTLGDTLAEIARQRRSTPDLLKKSVRGDLDWIVMKALEKQRNRRYDTAAELAADINRHLNNEPVQAAAPGFLYRARKFTRRHRIGVLAGLLVILAICAILSALSVSTVLIWREQGRTRRAFEKEQKALRYETQARMVAEREIRKSQAVVDFLNNDLLASVDPSRALGRQVMVLDVLNAASEKIEGRFESEPLVEASIRRTLGSTYKALGNYTAAEAHYERNLSINLKQLGQEHNNTLTSMGDLAELYRVQGKYDQAESLYEKLLEISPRVLGAEHPHTLVFMNNFAMVCHQKGRYEQAEELYLRTLEIRKHRLGEEHPHTLTSMNNLGGLYYDMGQYEKAETMQLKALEIQERVLGREHPDTLMLMSNIAALYMAQAKYEKAESLFLTTLPTQKRVLGEDHPGTMTTTNNLAHVYRSQERYDEAEPLYERVLEVNTRKLGEEHQHTLAAMNNLAELYRAQQRYDESKQLHLKALEIKKRVLGREHPDTLAAMNNLAELYKDQGFYDDAETLHLETLEISKRVLGEQHPNTLSTMNNLAMVYMFQSEFQKAETLHLRTFELREQVLRPGHPYIERTIRHLVELYDTWGKPEEARKWRMRLPGGEAEQAVVQVAKYVIPEKNLKIPEELQMCYANLEKIRIAIDKYKKDKQTWPDWLSGLVPGYLSAEALFCPDDPAHKAKYSPDPKLQCSYSWELSSNPVPGNWDPTGQISLRAWKARQARLFGDVVSMVRCTHHGDNSVLNLSMGGQIYLSPLDWEYMFKPDYHFGEERSMQPSQTVAEAPSLSGDNPNQPFLGTGLPERTKLIASGSRASWSPDMTHLVFARPQGQGLQILELESGKITDLTTSGKDPIWSPDGRFIVYGEKPIANDARSMEVWLVTSKGGVPRKLANGGYPSWSQDGKTLFVPCRKESKILSLDVDNPDVEPNVFYEGPQSWYPAISPDGRHIAFGRPDELVIMDRQTRQIALIWPIPGRRGALPTWSPDSRQVAFGGFDNDPFGVWILDVQAEHAVQVADGPYTMPVWSPDGAKLAFDLRSGDVREIWVVQTQTIQGPKLNASQVAQLSKLTLDPRLSQPRRSTPSPQQKTFIGEFPPAFTLQDLKGQQVSLSDFKGKVVLLDFWATWCPPCVKAIPHLEALHKKYKDKGLVVIGLNNEEDHTKVGQFAQGRISYTVLLDANKQFDEYGIQGIPTLFYIGREGNVRYREIGFSEGKENEIETRIKELLSSEPNEKPPME